MYGECQEIKLNSKTKNYKPKWIRPRPEDIHKENMKKFMDEGTFQMEGKKVYNYISEERIRDNFTEIVEYNKVFMSRFPEPTVTEN